MHIISTYHKSIAFSLRKMGWLVISAFFVVPLPAQTVVDSLLKLIPKTAADTHRVNLYNELGWELKGASPDSARYFLNTSIVLAEKLKFPRGKGYAYNYLGVVETIHGNIPKAMEYYQKAMTIRQSLNDQKGVASLYNNMANIWEEQGQLFQALDNYQNAQRILEEMGDTARVVRSYYNISILHERLGDYTGALEYILQYLEMSERTNDLEGQANAWNIMGNIKTELDRPQEALVHYQKAYEIHEKLGNEWETSTALNNIGNTLDFVAEQDMKSDTVRLAVLEKLFADALEKHEKALAIRVKLNNVAGIGESYNNVAMVRKNLGNFYQRQGKKVAAEKEWRIGLDLLEKTRTLRLELGDQQGLAEVYNGFGDIYRRLGDLAKALSFNEQYLALATEIGDQKHIQNAYKDLARIHYGLGNYKIAYEFREKYDEMRYQRIDEKRVGDNEKREILYSDRKKQWQSEKELLLRDAQLQRATLLRNSLLAGALGLSLIVFLLYNRNRIKTKSNKALSEKNTIIEAERQRSEALLLNILPAKTAEELKEKGKAEAKRYESVTVMFTDFKGFTQIAEHLSAEDLVAELDTCFQAFDEITAKYQIEKIKTIGDAYMCVGGLPQTLPHHAEKVTAAALEMVAFLKAHNAQKLAKGQPQFQVRIGIHSGPVVAGIVGSRKFAYDIWGDTVNTAARMESSGDVGRVNLSESTYALVKDAFDCSYRGAIEAKNKGQLNMYFVESKK